MSSETQLLSAQEVADRFGVTRQTVARWAESGELTKIKIGGTLRIRADEIERLVQGNKDNVA